MILLGHLFESAELVFLPPGETQIFIKSDNRARDNSVCDQIEYATGRTIKVAVDIHKSNRSFVCFQKFRQGLVKNTLVQVNIFWDLGKNAAGGIGTGGQIVPSLGKALK